LVTSTTVVLATIITVCLLGSGNAFAHNPRIGLYYQPNPFFALIFLGAASSALFAIIVKRVNVVLCIYLLGGSAVMLCFAMAGLTSLASNAYGIEPYYAILPYYDTFIQVIGYLVGVSIGGLVGGVVLSSYYLFSIRPYKIRQTAVT
jgi:hypothetical protein